MITLSNAAAISKAKIESLKPDFNIKVRLWWDECAQAGILPYIYEGFRSLQRQNELYAQGRTAPGKIVTNAEAGQSFHNYGRAFDWVPLVRAVKADGMYEAGWDFEPHYHLGNIIGQKHGLRSLSWETPHLEDNSFATWRDLAPIIEPKIVCP